MRELRASFGSHGAVGAKEIHVTTYGIFVCLEKIASSE